MTTVTRRDVIDFNQPEESWQLLLTFILYSLFNTGHQLIEPCALTNAIGNWVFFYQTN